MLIKTDIKEIEKLNLQIDAGCSKGMTCPHITNITSVEYADNVQIIYNEFTNNQNYMIVMKKDMFRFVKQYRTQVQRDRLIKKIRRIMKNWKGRELSGEQTVNKYFYKELLEVK